MEGFLTFHIPCINMLLISTKLELSIWICHLNFELKSHHICDSFYLSL